MVETKNEAKTSEKPSSNGLESKMYSILRDKALKKSLEYFKGDELAATVFLNKYSLKDSQGNIYEKTPEDMHKRIAKEIARIEKKYPNPLDEEKIYSLLDNFKYIIPQGSPMSGIGNPFQKVSLSNCFVIGNNGPSDSYGAIMQIDQEQIQLMKRRGGVGHDLSHIRPGGSPVENSALTSTGIVPFMERYSNSTREVAQDGRRGALMLSISIKHPDSEKFIDAKIEQGKVTGANVSVRIDDEFMKAVKEGKKYIQQYPVNSKNPTYKKEIDARKLWEKIAHNAWKSAEPGILFWDTIIKESVPDCYSEEGYKTVSTNPCGEIPLCPYDSCRLLAVNLYSYVDEPFTKNAKFNKELFIEHAGYAQRIMDDIIDLELEKIDDILEKVKRDPEDEEIKKVEYNLWEKIRQKAKEGRRTGIGVTGEGDMLAALGLRYGSNDGNKFSEEVHKEMALEVYRASVETAKERGAFKIYDFEKEKNNPFIQRLFNEDKKLEADMKKYGRRNIALLTVAPTGTTSIMTQTTSGLEQVFQISYTRRKKVNPNDKDVKIVFVDDVKDSWEEYNVFHNKFEKWLEINGYNVEETKKYDKEKLDEIVKKSPYYKATSNDVDWIKKVELQGAVQKWVDHSISVTVNLPNDSSEKLVGDLYMKAWEEGCKGITVYRDGSRSGVLLTGNEKEKDLEGKLKNMDRKEKFGLLQSLVKERLNEERPENIIGRTAKVPTPYGKAFIDLRWEKDYENKTIGPYEAFVKVGKSGEDMSAITEGYGRLLSLALKGGISIEDIIEQLTGIGGETQQGFGEAKVKSLPDGIAKGLQEAVDVENKYSGNENGNKKNKNSIKSGNLCSKCGFQLVMQESCEKCLNCGDGKCG